MYCSSCDKSFSPIHSRCPECNAWLKMSDLGGKQAPAPAPAPVQFVSSASSLTSGGPVEMPSWGSFAPQMAPAAPSAPPSPGEERNWLGAEYALPGHSASQLPPLEIPEIPSNQEIENQSWSEEPAPSQQSKASVLLMAGLVATVGGFLYFSIKGRRPTVTPTRTAATPTVVVGDQFLASATRHMKEGNFTAAARELDDCYTFFSAKGDAKKLQKINSLRREAKLRLAHSYLTSAEQALASHDKIRASTQAEASLALLRQFSGPSGEIQRAQSICNLAAAVGPRPTTTDPAPPPPVDTPVLETPTQPPRPGSHPRTQPPVAKPGPVASPRGPERPVSPVFNPPAPKPPEDWRKALHKDDATYRPQ